MKKTIALLLCIATSTVYAQNITHNDKEMSKEDYIQFLEKYSFWAAGDKAGKVFFCFGAKFDGGPVCSKIPDRYVVFKLPTKQGEISD